MLGGCGEDGQPEGSPTSSESASESASPTESPSESPTPSSSESAPPDAPECAQVWRADGRIPRIYPGCMEGDVFVEREGRACSSGQRLVHYRHFYGVPGGTVHKGTKPLTKDPGFRRAAIECVA